MQSFDVKNTYSVCNLEQSLELQNKRCVFMRLILFFSGTSILTGCLDRYPTSPNKKFVDLPSEDFDGDLYGENDGDLDDNDPTIYPGTQKNFVMKRTTTKMVKSTKDRKITMSTIPISTKMVLVTIQPDTQHVSQKTHWIFWLRAIK